MKPCTQCPLCLHNRRAFLPQILSHNVTGPQQSCLWGAKPAGPGRSPRCWGHSPQCLFLIPRCSATLLYWLFHCSPLCDREWKGFLGGPLIWLSTQGWLTTGKGEVPRTGWALLHAADLPSLKLPTRLLLAFFPSSCANSHRKQDSQRGFVEGGRWKGWSCSL